MEHVIVIGLGLVLGIPLAALAYWWTKRNQKLGVGSGYSGDYTGGGGGGSSDGGGGGGDGSSN